MLTNIKILNDVIWVTLGGIFGANLRYFISTMSSKYISASLPWGTLIVNVTGSLVIGFFLTWVTEQVFADPRLRLLIVVGFCGAYTTFSSYSYETVALLQQSHYGLALMNCLVNNVFSLLATLTGVIIARAL